MRARVVTRAAVCLVVLCSCVWISDTSRRVKLSKTVAWDLLSPAQYRGELESLYMVSTTFDDQTLTLLLQMSVNNRETVMNGLTPAMTPVFSLNDDGVVLQQSKSLSGIKELDPRYVLTDMQLAYWPFDELQQSLSAVHVLLREFEQANTEGKTVKHRVLSRGEDLADELIHIRYLNNADQIAGDPAVLFEHRVWNYRHRIVRAQ